MVYFLRSPRTGLIKIGRTRFLQSRLADLEHQYQETLEVLGVLPDALDSHEADLHRAFRRSRMQGEWFEPTKELMHVIKARAVPWSIEYDDNSQSVIYTRIDRAVWHRAKRLAKEEGIEVGQWISDRLRPLVQHAAY